MLPYHLCSRKENFMSVKEKNQEKILRMLQCHGSLNVSAVMKALKLSEPTVRRYFAEMEHAGRVYRFHGGIRPVVNQTSGYLFNEAVSSFTAEKHQIGIKGAALIDSHDRLFFDSGTTVLECGNALTERLGKRELSDLRIITNSLAFSAGLAPHCPVVLTGGMMRLERMDLCGTVALENVRRYNFTKAFLGTDAVSDEGILSTTDEETSSLAAAVMEQSDEIFILADSSKLGKSSFVPYGSLNTPKTTLITDLSSGVTCLEKLQKKGFRIIFVSTGKNEDQKKDQYDK